MRFDVANGVKHKMISDHEVGMLTQPHAISLEQKSSIDEPIQNTNNFNGVCVHSKVISVKN